MSWRQREERAVNPGGEITVITHKSPFCMDCVCCDVSNRSDTISHGGLWSVLKAWRYMFVSLGTPTPWRCQTGTWQLTPSLVRWDKGLIFQEAPWVFTRHFEPWAHADIGEISKDLTHQLLNLSNHILKAAVFLLHWCTKHPALPALTCPEPAPAAVPAGSQKSGFSQLQQGLSQQQDTHWWQCGHHTGLTCCSKNLTQLAHSFSTHSYQAVPFPKGKCRLVISPVSQPESWEF